MTDPIVKCPSCKIDFKLTDSLAAQYDDPLVFMTNNKFLKGNNLQAPQSCNDVLGPAYKKMLQMPTPHSGTAVSGDELF